MTDLLVEAVAAYRLTRLVTLDTITEPLRDRYVALTYRLAGQDPTTVEAKAWQTLAEAAMDDPGHPLLAELATCRWCAGMWCAFAVLALRHVPGGRLVRDALALGAAAVLLARLEGD